MKEKSPNKIQVDYTLNDIYDYYKKEHKDDELMVDKKLFKKITYEFNKRIMKYILEEASTFKIPKRLGEIRIKKTKMNFNNDCKIDWATTKKYNKKVYHMNDHTNNYRYRFYWHKFNCNAKNKTAYCFESTRTNKRRLAYLLKNKTDEIDYFL